MKRIGLVTILAAQIAIACEDGSELGAGALGAGGNADASDGAVDLRDATSEGPRDAGDTADGQLEGAAPPDSAPDVPEGGAQGIPETPPDGADARLEHEPDGSGDASGGAPEGSSVLIVAREGGVVRHGGAELLVPADALVADLTIRLGPGAPSAVGGGADVRGKLFTLEPPGTSFEVPVVLTLPLDQAPPAGQDAVIAWRNEATHQWVPVPSYAEAGKVTGLVPHFTTFAVLFVPKMNPCPFAGGCGGSPEGAWKYSSACLRTPNPLGFSCGTGAAVQIRQSIEVGGTISLSNGQYASSQMVVLRSTVFVTPECIAALNAPETLHADCASVQASLRMQRGGQWTCHGTITQGCSCLLINRVTRNEMGAVMADGQKLSFTKQDSQSSQTSDFCVQNNVLTFRDSLGAVYSAVKQP